MNTKNSMKRIKPTLLASALILLGTLQLQAQTVGGAVYGGGRKANVSGTATVTVKSSSQQQMVTVVEGGVETQQWDGQPYGVGAVYGGNDIAGRVSGAIVVDLQGGVIGDVFGGGNGNYGCSNPDGVYTGVFSQWNSDPDVSDITGKQVPVVNNAGTMVKVHGENLQVTGAIYAGGNLASVGLNGTTAANQFTSSAHVYLGQGQVHDVYGGARMAPIFGTNGLTFTSNSTTQLPMTSVVRVTGSVYAGNDIANLTSSANATNGSITVGGKPQISGNVFGGGNGDYIYYPSDHATLANQVWTIGTTDHPSTYVATLCSGYGKPTVNTSSVSIAMTEGEGTAGGHITGTVYGGGNAADVLTSTSVTLTSGTVGTIYGGCNKSDNGGTSTVTLNGGEVATLYGGNNVSGNISGNVTVNLNKGTVSGQVFGGGNGDYGCNTLNDNDNKYYYDGGTYANLTLPSVAGTITVKLEKTANETLSVNDIYGGGNMAPSNTTNVQLIAGNARNVYGGGRMAPVTNGTVYFDQNYNGTLANVFAGNDIANTTAAAQVAAGSVTVQGSPTITGAVYGGGNGDYVYDTDGKVYTNDNAHTHIATLCTNMGKPAVNTGAVTVNTTDGTIAAVYGGGNNADVFTSSTVTINSGNVTTVYGGCNKSNVTGIWTGEGENSTLTQNTGISSVILPATYVVGENTLNNSAIVGTIYGGNDKSGSIAGLSSVSIAGGTVNGNVFGGSNGDYAEVNNAYPYGTKPTNVNTQVTVDGGTFAQTSNVFGGGNAATVSGTATVEVNSGTIQGNVFGGGNLATVGTTDVDITGGTINTLYGGGNQGGVTTSDVLIAGGNVTTAYAGGNAATVSTSATITVDEADDATATVGTLFGGNNQATMAILPTINLTDGEVHDVYGGGNAGDMTAQVALSTKMTPDAMTALGITDDPTISTYVNINNTNINITGNVYGGCKAANVGSATASAAFVNAQAGTVHAIFGGNDVAGRCANTYVHLNGATVTDIYGGANGMYDYTSSGYSAYTRPSTDKTHVFVNHGTATNVYGGGLAGDCGETYLLVDGDATLTGANIFGAGCGDENQKGQCVSHLGNVTNLAKTDIKSMNPNSTVTAIYGGGNAGDVQAVQLKVYPEFASTINTLYGGCNAANIAGTAQTILDLGTDGRINTVFGGNDFAGWVNKVDLQLLTGSFGDVYGAGNGDYDYASYCDKVPYNNDVNITIGQNAYAKRTENDNLHIKGTLYGGGYMGVVGFDYNHDGNYTNNTTATYPTTKPQYATGLFANKVDNLGDYGRIHIVMYGGTITGNLFGGACGKARVITNDVYGTEGRNLVYGFKQVDIYNGTIEHSVYGGSEAVNDGYPWECLRSNETTEDNYTTMRPSSILNIMGGEVQKNVYGAGYKGEPYGSAYVNVGVKAVDSCAVYNANYAKEFSSETRRLINDMRTYDRNFYSPTKPNYTTVYNQNDYPITRVRDLNLRASIYNGSDWGEAGATADFTAANFHGGESRILVDGAGYNTTSGSTSEPIMDIQYSLFGSGTSVEGGDMYRNITVRNYGDASLCSTGKRLYSIQRANDVVLQNVGLTLIGEEDATASYPSADFAISWVDDVVILRGENQLNLESPIVEIAKLESQKNDAQLRGINDVPTLDNRCGDACSRVDGIKSTLHNNVILLNNGTYITVRRDGTYGDVSGFCYIDAFDGTKGNVVALYQSENGNAVGGFVAPCVSTNHNLQNGITQLPYTNVGSNYRNWTFGDNCGTSGRAAAIVANSQVNAANHDIALPSVTYTTTNEGTSVSHNLNLALAHVTLELPPANEDTYYTISTVDVGDANGDNVTLLNSAYYIAPGYHWDDANPTTGLLAKSLSNTNNAFENDDLRQLAEYPNTTFGLAYVTNGNFKTATDTEYPVNILSGTANYSATTGFTNTNPVGNDDSNDAALVQVVPTMELYLTYNPTFTNTLLRDITFTLTEHRADGTCTNGSPIKVTLSMATIVTEFNKFEADVLAMYNEGIANEYVRKVIIPSTYERREIILESVQWKCESNNTNHTTGNGGCFDDKHLFHLVNANTAYDYNAANADHFSLKNFTNFGLRLALSQSTGDESSNTLGWYDIPSASTNLDIYSAVTNAVPSVNADGTTNNYFYKYGTTATECNRSSEMSIGTNGTATAEAMLAQPISLGTLDGRATAAIDVKLQFDGNNVYENHYEGSDKVGTILLGMYYWKDVEIQEENGTVRIEKQKEPFTLAVNVKTREKADTIYIASATEITIDGHIFHANDGNDNGCIVSSRTDDGGNATQVNPGKSPDEYLHILDNVFLKSVFNEGDVIAVMGEMELSDDRSYRVGDDNWGIPLQIIRYSGTHDQFFGDNAKYTGPMFTLSGNTTLKLRNVRMNGSGLTRTKYDLSQNWHKSVIRSEAPMVVVKDNATLDLDYKVTMTNNVNKGAIDHETHQAPANYSFNVGTDYLPGGAIGVYKTNDGTPKVVLTSQVDIFDNIVIDVDGHNNGAGIYVDGGQVVVGGDSRQQPVITIEKNYITSDIHPETNATTTSQPVSLADRTKGFTCPLNPSNAADAFEVYVLNPGTSMRTNNVFLTRKASTVDYADIATNVEQAQYDSQSDFITFKTELGAETRVGITKWFEDEAVASILNPEVTNQALLRDTIRFAYSQNVHDAQVAYANGNFFLDNATYATVNNQFYNALLNQNNLYLQHCATFAPRQSADLYVAADLVQDFVLLPGFTDESDPYSLYPAYYHYVNSADICAVPTEHVDVKLQGGFYPYTYDWTVGDNNIRHYTTLYGPEITKNTDADLARRIVSSTDTITLREVALLPGQKEKEASYIMNATDLAGCPVSMKVNVHVERTPDVVSWMYLGEDHEEEILTAVAPSANGMEAFNQIAVDNEYYFLRAVKGVPVEFQVAPSWNYGNITFTSEYAYDGNTKTVDVNNTYEGNYTGTITEDYYFCPGDELILTTEGKQPTTSTFLMWDFDPTLDQQEAHYIVPSSNAKVKAIYGPNDYWYQVVTSQPETFTVTYDGNVTIHNEQDLAWLISTTNGLNGQTTLNYHYKTITIQPKEGGYNMSAHRWTPLGNAVDKAFAGTFIVQGDENPIEGIICFEDQVPEVGFFGNLEGATIQNLQLTNSTFRGHNYVGGIAAKANGFRDGEGYTFPTTIANCATDNLTIISGNYIVGTLVGELNALPASGAQSAVANVINNNTVDASDICGNAMYAGGLIGVMNGDNDVENNYAKVDATKVVLAQYLGGVAGNTTGEPNTGAKGRKRGAKSGNAAQAQVANNYIYLLTNGDHTLTVGGLVGQASDVNLENNYVYGEVHGLVNGAAIVASMGDNVSIDRCYYAQGTSDNAFGNGLTKAQRKAATNVTAFTGSGNQVLTDQMVGGINNVTRILNRWVREQGEGYNTWRSDLKHTNHGYPLFGEPDMIPVLDTMVEHVCDQFDYAGATYTTDALFTIQVVDSLEMIDSTLTLIYTVGHSEFEEYSAEAQAEEGYEGYGFSLTAEELEQMMDGATDVRTFILVDSLLTESGCDSVITLTLTVYPKLGIGDAEVEVFDVSVYPNPTRGLVSVESKGITLIEVYDNASRRMMTVKAQGDKEQLNLSHLATGTYYIRVTTEHGTAVKKVVKK